MPCPLENQDGVQYQPDIVIRDRFGALVAIVAVKALNNPSTQIATRYLRNLLSHGVVPHVRYILLITEEAGYLWTSADSVLHEHAPSLTFPMDSIVRHYLLADGGTGPVGDIVLEAIVRVWLEDMVDGIEVDAPLLARLQKAGFLDAVRDGQVNVHASV